MKNSNYRIASLAIVLILLFGLMKWGELLSYSTFANQQPGRTQTADTYGKLPMSFELNQGQADPQVKYLARGRGYQVFLTDTEAVLALRIADSGLRIADLKDPSPKSQSSQSLLQSATHNPQSAIRNPQSRRLRLKLDGAKPAEQVIGVNPLPGKSNYFIGNDPRKWHTDIINYSRVEYRNVYPGISLAYYGTQQALEYDFIVAPGADPQAITVSFEGADRMELDSRGDLLLHLNGEVIYQRIPVIYQNIDGRRRNVSGRYFMKGERQIGIKVDGYDAARSLVIDPVLEYSTYIGGGGDDLGQSIKVDGGGNAYIAGVTAAADFGTKDALQGVSRGGLDAFITKINSNGTALIYSTYLGGSGDDAGNGITLDAEGNAYVVGYTTSTNFNTLNPLQASNRGIVDAFVAKINPAGSQLVYSTYLGSSSEDIGFAISVDAANNAYVTGYTAANDFNTRAPLQPAFRGGFDAFVAKLDPAGSALIYSTYLGGSEGDLGTGIIVDSAGNAYISGYTTSPDFNTKDPLQPTYRGGLDGFVAKIDAAGAALVYSTYLGGGNDDQCYGIALDATGSAYVTGTTSSTDFPTRNPIQNMRSGSSDAFVTRISASGADLLLSSYLGGSGSENGRGIFVDTQGNIYLTGDTTSTNFPNRNAIQAASRGSSDAFIARLVPGGSGIVFATYLGGSRTDTSYSIAVDGSGNIYITGATASLDFNTNNPLQSDNLGGMDAFVAKVTADGTQFAYSTYLGGSGNDLGLNLTVDVAGNTYVTGFTTAADFKVESPLQQTSRGNSDAFVAKINAAGSAFIYSTYFGGSGLDLGQDIAVDQAGNAYITGVTASADFSTRNPFQSTIRGGGDAFIAKLNATGTDLVYSTYFGGSSNDSGSSIAVDDGGNIYLAGSTGSFDLTTQSPLQPINRGEDDAFIAKINAAGTGLIYSTYLGGSRSESAFSMAVDGIGNAYVTGVTTSSDFNTSNPLQAANGGMLDAFVAKINNDGSALSYSTYLGGSGSDFGYGIAVDAAGNAYVTGSTSSTDFNTRNPLQAANRGIFDAFVTKINPEGSMLVYSTYLGGSNSDTAYSIAVDALGNAYLTGNTSSTNFPVKDATQSNNRGGIDAFVTSLDAAGGDLVFSTYLGGSGLDEGDSIALDSLRNIYVTGQTGSVNFPLANAVQGSASGGIDAFILKISMGGNVPGAAASVSAASFVGTELASESIIAAFGTGLATSTQSVSMLPLPTTLAGTSVKVKDSAGVERPALLFYISPTQVNYQLPEGTATGMAMVTITSGDGKVSTGTPLISSVAPGLFSANSDGLGVAAATAVRMKADGTQISEAVAQFDPVQNKFVTLPLDLGPEGEQVFLILYGCGIRFRSNLSAVLVKIGGVDMEVQFAGPQGFFVGLDQINIPLPRSLAGRGDLDINLTVDGKAANVVQVGFK